MLLKTVRGTESEIPQAGSTFHYFYQPNGEGDFIMLLLFT
jgi:hypothetical protein